MAACPQCGSIDFTKSGSRSNYNMAKGMIGQALGGDVGSLAGFENQTVWECQSCGCLFVEGLNKNKIVSRGYKSAYYNVGYNDVTVTGTNGYKYVVCGIHLDVFKNNIQQNHFEIPTFERVEYQLNNPILIVNYLCKDGKVRAKQYTDLSAKDLEKLIYAMRESIRNFQKDANYSFLMKNSRLTTIVELKQGGKTYMEQERDITFKALSLVLKLSGVIALFFALIFGLASLDLNVFFGTFIIAFIIISILMCFG